MAFINERELASQGQMSRRFAANLEHETLMDSRENFRHEDFIQDWSERFPDLDVLTLAARADIDFYKTGTGDKASGMFVRRTPIQIVVIDAATFLLHTFDLVDGNLEVADTNSQTMTAVISDGHPDHSGRLPVRIVADDQFISIFPTGYGDCGSVDGYGCPVSIELYEGRLRLIVFEDIHEGDPTIIDLEAAREDRL